MAQTDVQQAERLARIRQGDPAALAAAFAEHRQRLLRTIGFRLDPRLRSRLDAEDILQEAYLNAAQRCVHLEGESATALFIWLRLIVLQTIADVARRHLAAQRRDAGREIDLHAATGAATTSVSLAERLAASLTSPSGALRRAEAAEHLQAALALMDEIDREVLCLRHFEELSNREVAAVLGIQQKAASIRYVRALRRLRELLMEFPGVDWTRLEQARAPA
jgi:RNA polymerase sigma-70 factor (ECF subfamily)